MDCSKLGLLIENGERLDLVDVRPRDKFAAAHIPGARSMPLPGLRIQTADGLE